jgi:hypothetical protein
MNAIIDSSSLLAFVRYYLPFDKDSVLKNLLKEKFESGELVVIDKVYDEIKFQSKGIVIKELEFLSDKKRHKKTSEIYPNKRFFNMLENQYSNKAIIKAKGISEVEFEIEKTKYLDSADCRLILYALNHQDELEIVKPLIITEESRTNNDGKPFKKIPDICELSGIPHCTLQTLLKDYFKVDMIFNI